MLPQCGLLDTMLVKIEYQSLVWFNFTSACITTPYLRALILYILCGNPVIYCMHVNCNAVFGLGVFGMVWRHALVSLRQAAPFLFLKFFFFKLTNCVECLFIIEVVILPTVVTEIIWV